MGNQINNIFTLANDKKYLVLNQGVYQGKNYFYVVRVSDDEQEVEDEFALLEEVNENGENYVKVVEDKNIIMILAKYLSPKTAS